MSSCSFLPTFLPLPSPKHPTITTTYTSVYCGPRNNRGPLVKGRILSIEAIHAIQSLKRSPENIKTLSRLLKPDLVSTLHELLRQERLDLALIVFTTLKKEYYDNVDLSLYANIIVGLCKRDMWPDVDLLISDIERSGVDVFEDEKGLVKLVRGLVENGERVEFVVRIYELMKRCGSDTCKVDDYLVKVLSRGFRKFAEVGLAEEVEREFGGLLGKSRMGNVGVIGELEEMNLL